MNTGKKSKAYESSTIDYIKSNDKAKEIPNKAIDCIYKYFR